MSDSTPPLSLLQYWQQLRKPLELEVAHGCLDTAIVGAGVGIYARLWAQRLADAGEEDRRLALSIARGLRDYAEMPVAERKRRAMAAVDMLRKREAEFSPATRHAATTPSTPTPTPRKRTRSEPAPRERCVNGTLPAGQELLASSIELLAPRAQWPKLLANKLQIYTVRDLLYHIPRDWVEITPIPDLQDGTRAAIVGTVSRRESDRLKSAKSPQPLYKYTLTIPVSSTELWITAITIEPERARGGRQSWSPMKLPFTPGQRVFALGRIDRTGKIVEMRMDDIFALSDEEAAFFAPGARVPIYPLTAGVYQNQVSRAVLRALAALSTPAQANADIDPLPATLRAEFNLKPLVESLYQVHHPNSPTDYEQGRTRLAFEEFLVPQLLLAQRHWAQRHDATAPVPAAKESLVEMAHQLAPFTPTPAQLRVLGEIEEDLRSPRPMNRMVQGDVGSGKTFLAVAAAAFIVRSGLQAAVMAPTEILAEQLYLVLTRMLAPLEIKPVLLTGSASAAERRAALDGLASGRAPIAVGTHALIQEGVAFHDLGLVIIDEQHRFGVAQRAVLRSKGMAPNTLVMSATPIPRSMALTMYGDLDLSLLDGMPPGRHPVATRWLPFHHLHEAYADIRTQVAQGRQAYVVCPLVEASELLQANAAVEMAAELQHVFPEMRVALLHGRMRPEEKDAVMEAFRSGQTHILAATTVIEVGVDVPNATIIIIHNAERFGLSQLHQLRGRVGRSHHASTCYLLTAARVMAEEQEQGESPAKRRLKIMLEEQDGFVIAEADLQIRGPGEYLGTRQSGLLDYQIGHLLKDGASLEQARTAARAIIAADPYLSSPAWAELRRRAQRLKAKLDQFRE